MRQATAEPTDISQLELIDDQTADYLRSLGGTGRLALMDEIDRAARAHVAANVRRQHPDWDDARVKREVARIRLDGRDWPQWRAKEYLTRIRGTIDLSAY